jgi:ribosome recycling factor
MSNFGKELEAQCKATVDHFRKELQKTRTGRAQSGLLDSIHVEYYGSHVPLIQLGLINTPEPRVITVQVYDASAVEAVDKAIRQANIGLNPQREGSMLRMTIPALTEERRREIIKGLHKLAEESRVGVRSHRRESIDAIKKQEKAKEFSEDESRRHQDEVQKVTDKFIAEIDVLLVAKEKELIAG